MVILQKKSKKLGFSNFFQPELFKKLHEPSRAELFGQKLEPKTSRAEPSLGSDTTLLIGLTLTIL